MRMRASNPMKMSLFPVITAGLLLTACGEVEFEATDADGVAAIMDAGFTEESGMKGLITGDVFTPGDVSEFNRLAEDACADLANGFDADYYTEFEAEVMDGATDLEEFIDPLAMTVALVDRTCPTYNQTLASATGS